jgi:hypothetical protein
MTILLNRLPAHCRQEISPLLKYDMVRPHPLRIKKQMHGGPTQCLDDVCCSIGERYRPSMGREKKPVMNHHRTDGQPPDHIHPGGI